MTLLEQTKIRELVLKKYNELKKQNKPTQEIVNQLKKDFGSYFEKTNLTDFLTYNKIVENDKKINKDELKEKAEKILELAKEPTKNKKEIEKICKEIISSNADKSIKNEVKAVLDSINKTASIFTKKINESILNKFYSKIIKEDNEEENETQKIAQELLDKVEELYFDKKEVLTINKVINVLKIIDKYSDKLVKIKNNSTPYTEILKEIDKSRTKDEEISKEELENNLFKFINSSNSTYSNFDSETFALFMCFANLKSTNKELFTINNTYSLDNSFKKGQIENIKNDDEKKLIKKYYTLDNNDAYYKPNDLIKKINDTLKEIPALKSNEFGNKFSTLDNAIKYIKSLENKKSETNETNETNETDDISSGKGESRLERIQQAQKDANDPKSNSLLNTDNDSKTETPKTDEIIQKRLFYIFKSAKMLKIVNVKNSEDIQEFIDTIFDEAKKFVEDASKELVSYKKEEKTKFGDEENISEGLIGKIFKKVTGNKEETKAPQSYEEKYSKNVEDLEKLKQDALKELGDICTGTRSFLETIYGKAQDESEFNKKIKLERQFDEKVNEFGYFMTKAVQRYTRAVDSATLALRKDKRIEDLKNIKTYAEKGADKGAVAQILRVINRPNSNDNKLQVAKYMLTNLIMVKDSKEILNFLHQNNFNSFTEIVAFDKNGQVGIPKRFKTDESFGNGIVCYSYEIGETLKNPSELLNAVNINPNLLNYDVLKQSYDKVKEDAEKEEAESKKYINQYNKIPEFETQQSDETETDPIKKIIKQNGIKLNIDIKNINPTQNGPEDLALKQYLYHNYYYLFVIDGKEVYALNETEAKKLKKQTIQNKTQSKQLNTVAQNETTTPTTPTAPTTQNNTIGKVGGEKGMSPSASVTTANVDSTYGNGYNKKADAIKKKLNCTTYTYSPNPKLKIVRRTFD